MFTSSFGSKASSSSGRRGSIAGRLPNYEKENERFVFILSFFDTQAGFDRFYQLIYYSFDETIEMFDVKSKKIYLKRMKSPVALKDIYVGGLVTINARQYKVTEYADDFTKKTLGTKTKFTLAIIKPDGVSHMGGIIDRICKEGFRISKMKMCELTVDQAQKFYEVHKGKVFYNTLVSYMTSGPIIAMELCAEDAVQKWRTLIGPTDYQRARREAPNSIRALYATDATHNAVHGSDSDENAKIESNFFFNSKEIQTSARFENSTLGIILPHILSQGESIGEILLDILKNGMDITAMELFNLQKVDAADFLEVYKGVVPEYQKMVEHLSSGPCIALEVTSNQSSQNVVTYLREVCGPSDSDLARELKPNSIRAKYGMDKVKNAVHCTDLEEDGILEVQFFFDLMQK
ncbi:hypothetical protein ABK040_007070 [Willaertia magna]